MFALPNELGACRLGVTVTRKFGGAVSRNRAKRRLRDVFRRNHDRLEPPYDLVINARRPLLERSATELERDFLSCFRRLGNAKPRRGGAS
jgi:ribonuclease P protein component